MNKMESAAVAANSKNRLVPTPPMGWNSWDCYGASVNEEEVIGNANYVAEHLKSYGWEYIVVDAQWYEPTANCSIFHPFVPLEMDEYSRLIPAVNRFPSAADGRGFRSLADRIHAMGLKFGIHILRGIPRQAVHSNTPILGSSKGAREIAHTYSICNWITDMYGIQSQKEGAQAYYNSIFQLYAEWEIDYVKVDDISHPYSKGEIELIRGAIDRCGRDIVLSLSPGPAPLQLAEHLKEQANLWRVSADFWDDWKYLYKSFEYSSQWIQYGGPGSWPDLDMLPLGHLAIRSKDDGVGERMTRFTRDEQRTMVSLWCLCQSPLIFGGELRSNDEWTLSLLTNREVLAMHRNGHSIRELYREQDRVVWMSRGQSDEVYLGFFNIGDDEQNVAVELYSIDLFGTYKVTDLWTGEQHDPASALLQFAVVPHGVRLVRLDSI
ncbi:glycoside hydrolase family 27 protein [Paenibacillus mendelii]|uniref:Alpha-galactosidase n=1 Tax=Paenibacillus mendelii TaxID=206163 RepID=A0ABV6JF86_9BACL|nr:glycoside hydrolase family 27 protein [Paenibacillus mendelii]MCQ6563460.1 glycoside hydrolase family 27 protein [Paenibacillus mendelii]